jgi:hypothetical protein
VRSAGFAHESNANQRSKWSSWMEKFIENQAILYWVRLAEVKIEDSEEKKLSMKLLRKWTLGRLPRSTQDHKKNDIKVLQVHNE